MKNITCTLAFAIGTLPCLDLFAYSPDGKNFAVTASSRSIYVSDRSVWWGSCKVNWTDLPPSESYRELSPDAKNWLHPWYESLPDGDEPPYPTDGMGELARRAAHTGMSMSIETPLSGSATVFADVDSTGKVIEVHFGKGSHPEVSRAIRPAAAYATFKPASRKGKPCRMMFPIKMTIACEGDIVPRPIRSHREITVSP